MSICGSKSVSFECQDSTWRDLHGVMCTNSLCIAYDITPQYGTAKLAIKDWNTRTASPIGRCGECSNFHYNLENDTYCSFAGGLSDPEECDYCSYFER